MKERPRNPNQHYNGGYAKLYLKKTLLAPYTVRKSKLLASVASKLGVHAILDLGSNVHGSVKMGGSLRFQMNEKGIDYVGMDLSSDYFDKEFLRAQGIPEEKIYPQIHGIIGDILHIPIESDSTEMAVCADVLEHTSDPSKALGEIYRILAPKGMALVVIPSMYKLDMADFDHIKKKRKSSHLEKTTVDEWISMCEKKGFLVDKESSLPFGIASGLSYLTWIDECFIPERREVSGAETHTSESRLFKEVKSILSKYDELLDSKINSDGLNRALLSALKQGDIKKVFRVLDDVASVIASGKEKNILHNFFTGAISAQYPKERVEVLQTIFTNSKFPILLLGNSALLVLKKK